MAKNFFEIDFLPVGDKANNGDAILVRIKKSKKEFIHLIDGGFKASAETITNHMNKYYGKDSVITSVVCTHPDQDHASGLCTFIEDAPSKKIEKIYMNRPWLYSTEIVKRIKDDRITEKSLENRLKNAYPYIAKIDKIAREKKIEVFECFQGTTIGDFMVCSPSKERYLKCILDSTKTPDVKLEYSAEKFEADKLPLVTEYWKKDNLREDVSTSSENETSIVQFAKIEGQQILLTGDAGKESLAEAYAYAVEKKLIDKSKSLNFVQIPHHGGRRNLTPTILDSWLGNIMPKDNPDEEKRGSAYASVAKENNTHPKKAVVNAFIRRGYKVFKTHGHNMLYSTSGAPKRPGWSKSSPCLYESKSESWDKN